jgi:hypothetical protein
LLGYQCLYVSDAVVYHAYTNRFSARKLSCLERNRAVMLLKVYRWQTLAFMLPALMLAECVAWGYALKSGPAFIGAKLAAYGWVAVHWPAIMRRRRAVQRIRRISDRELLHMLAARVDFVQLAGARLGLVAGAIVNPLFVTWYRFMDVIMKWAA